MCIYIYICGSYHYVLTDDVDDFPKISLLHALAASAPYIHPSNYPYYLFTYVYMCLFIHLRSHVLTGTRPLQEPSSTYSNSRSTAKRPLLVYVYIYMCIHIRIFKYACGSQVTSPPSAYSYTRRHMHAYA